MKRKLAIVEKPVEESRDTPQAFRKLTRHLRVFGRRVKFHQPVTTFRELVEQR